MDQNVTLKSIEFKENGGGVISFIQCTYSNQIKSPPLEKEGYPHYNSQVIDFTDVKQVRKVSATCDIDPWRYILKTRFFDKHDFPLKEYNPRNYAHPELF